MERGLGRSGRQFGPRIRAEEVARCTEDVPSLAGAPVRESASSELDGYTLMLKWRDDMRQGSGSKGWRGLELGLSRRGRRFGSRIRAEEVVGMFRVGVRTRRAGGAWFWAGETGVVQVRRRFGRDGPTGLGAGIRPERPALDSSDICLRRREAQGKRRGEAWGDVRRPGDARGSWGSPRKPREAQGRPGAAGVQEEAWGKLREEQRNPGSPGKPREAQGRPGRRALPGGGSGGELGEDARGKPGGPRTGLGELCGSGWSPGAAPGWPGRPWGSRRPGCGKEPRGGSEEAPGRLGEVLGGLGGARVGPGCGLWGASWAGKSPGEAPGGLWWLQENSGEPREALGGPWRRRGAALGEPGNSLRATPENCLKIDRNRGKSRKVDGLGG